MTLSRTEMGAVVDMMVCTPLTSGAAATRPSHVQVAAQYQQQNCIEAIQKRGFLCPLRLDLYDFFWFSANRI